jgi:L-seryl-tRNA(Ser) seleniumtransferase
MTGLPEVPAAPRLPATDAVLRSPNGRAMAVRYGATAAAGAARRELASLRALAQAGRLAAMPTAEAVAVSAQAALEASDAPSLRRVFNLTGTVLHTNLGRALLPEEAVAAVAEAMRHPVTLEYDLATGRRGERDDHVRALVRELTGAEDCVVVNNNAAAVLLALSSLAAGREVIVSRGELIEIGGSFRIPEIMRRAGARLREAGTTNRTHARDIEEAIGPRTGAIMKVHTSNYVVQGFTAAVGPDDLKGIARRHSVPLIDDLGSGTLVDLSRHGLARERTVQQALEEGADLVTFSGDKLLGGPQAGIIAGRADLVARCARNQLRRALRIDKLRLAALEATLKLYRHPERLAERLPTLRLFTRRPEDLAAQAGRLLPALQAALPPPWRAEVTPMASQIGSGALPVESIPGSGLRLSRGGRRGGPSADKLAAAFRRLPIPVIGRIHDGALLLDLRCLDDEAAFRDQLAGLAA